MRVDQDTQLAEQIYKIHKQFPYYGYRRLKEVLGSEGLVVNHKRIKRVMKEYGIYTTIPKSYKVTTQSRHKHYRYKNLLRSQKARRPNQVWATDMTYIRVSGSFVYLAIVMDLYSRKIIGWSLGRRLNTELALRALERSIEQRNPPERCIHHSDQGVQYCSEEYIELLKRYKFRISMSATGNPYDNATVESFMRTIKMEEVYLTQYRSFEEVLERVPLFIENVYNKQRLHSSLDYKSPEDYEANYNPKN